MPRQANHMGGGAPRPEIKGLALVAVIVVLAMANFVAILDLTIANVLVPHIAGALAASPSDGTWVITAYAVAEAITVPLTGWLAERFGPVRVFVLCIIAFGVFSALCGMATSLSMLIFCRIALGVAGGPLIPLSQTLLYQLVPPRHATPALAVWTMTTIIAPIIGPALGGILGDTWGWSWAFYINVPFTIVAGLLAWWLLTPHESPARKVSLDVCGLGLLILWVGALQIMLGNGQDWDWFNSSAITALFVVVIVGFGAFVIWEVTEKTPVVNLRIFANRGFSVSVFVIALVYGALFGSTILTPLWLQTDMGYTATLAGYNTAFAGIFSIFAGPLTAALMKRVDHRLLVFIGLLFAALSTLVRVFFNQDMTFNQLLWPQVALGIAFPMIVIPLMDMSIRSLPMEDTASGAGQRNFVRTLSSAISTAIVIAVWNSAITVNRAILVDQLQHPQALLARLHAGGFSARGARQILDSMVESQSVMLGTNRAYLGVGLAMLVAAAVVWLAPKPVTPSGRPQKEGPVT
jgi:DHA2 family multidrug resistance protein